VFDTGSLTSLGKTPVPHLGHRWSELNNSPPQRGRGDYFGRRPL